MTPVQLLISFFTAVIVTAFFAGFLRTSGPWRGFWIFFIIIFFITLAASQWVVSAGPSVYGYYWIPGLFAAVIFMILIASVTPKKGPQKEEKNKEEDTQKVNAPTTYYSPSDVEPKNRIYQGDEPAKFVAWSGFLWVFIFLLMIVVIIVALISS